MNPSCRFCLIFAALLIALPLNAIDTFVYFGSHRSGPGIGFSLAHFDTDTGVLTKPEFLLEAQAPAFFTLHPDGRHLYTCNSNNPGGLSAYAIDPHTGALKLINRQLTGGNDATYVCLDQSNRYALVANYEGANIAAFSIKPDRSLGDWTAFVQHAGKSIHPKRQTHAYPHSIIIDPTNRFVLVADLGQDKVFVYRFDESTGILEPNTPAYATAAAGSGPRHLKFHPNGRWVYLLNELACTAVGYGWDSAKGVLTEFQTISTLPADFDGKNTCAEVEVHPNGNFLYASNRGHDSLAVFAIDQASGQLTLVERVMSGGKSPSNFAFDPTRKWIVCTNHASDNAVVFRVDESTGRLTQTGAPVAVPYPFCQRFLPVK
jgi:6-phosphogluconolactonase